MTGLLGLDPSSYVPHALHRPDAAYPLTNCWTDVVIELLHSHGDEPLACLGSALTLDHEGDQLTFFKPRAADLRGLYGLDIHEYQPYRTLRSHAREQLSHGRTLLVEVDGWWLPDTLGTSYRNEHVKTTIAIASLDEHRLVYFHNAGLYALTGEDLEQVLACPSVEGGLPPYAELVRFDAGPRLTGEALRGAAEELLPQHLAQSPPRNPFMGFAEQLDRELPELSSYDETTVHALAFATTRMAGAAAALAAAHVRWVLADRGEMAAQALDRVATATRALTVRLARRRAFDHEPLTSGLAADWAEAHERLHALVD